MIRPPVQALFFASVHFIFHALVFLLSAIAVAYVAAGLSLSPFVTIPLTIGILSASPVLCSRTLRGFQGQRPDLVRGHLPTPIPTD